MEQEEYHSSDEATLRRIENVTLVAFVGPTAAGKNFNMPRLGYPQAGTLTNRMPRVSDINYRYPTGPEMLDMIEQGTLVQYAAIRPDKYYGSDADCYQPGGY
jgi:guanylate kinase